MSGWHAGSHNFNMAVADASRSYTISLRPEVAEKAEALAALESRTLNELFGEALDAYYAQHALRTLKDIGEYAASLNSGYTETDVPRLIAEVRAEEAAEQTQK